MSTTTLDPITDDLIDEFVQYLDFIDPDMDCESQHLTTGKSACTHRVEYLLTLCHLHNYQVATLRLCRVAARTDAEFLWYYAGPGCTCDIRPI